jgi:hypothetical protein
VSNFSAISWGEQVTFSGEQFLAISWGEQVTFSGEQFFSYIMWRTSYFFM